jgi:hypothetical protein
MSKEGWIKLYRQIQDNPIWTSESFTRGQAWVDLILLANHEDGYIYVRGNKIQVKRGQVGWSQKRLSQRWSWSRSKVRKFLKDLEEEQQIKQQKNNVSSLITIIKYKDFQKKEQQSKQQRDSRETAEEQQRDTNKNEKNNKNDKKRESAREIIQKTLNGFGKPLMAVKLFDRDEFSEAFLEYWLYRKESYNHWPNEYSVMECYRRLEELRQKGQDPVKVIRQTIRTSNKEFYPLKDQEFSRADDDNFDPELARRVRGGY